MRKKQVQHLWHSLDDSTSIADVIKGLKNKPGYDGESTLVRYAQVARGFKEGKSLQEICATTTWRLERVEKLKRWWEEAFRESVNGTVKPEFLTETCEEVQEEHNNSPQSGVGPTPRSATGSTEDDDSGGHVPQNGLSYPDISDYQIAHFFGVPDIKRIRRLLDLEVSVHPLRGLAREF